MKQSGSFTDMAFKPGDPSVMYAAERDRFYTSMNSGETWTMTWPADHSYFPGRIAIGVTPANPNYIYLIAGILGLSGVYRSEDGGKTFNLRADKPNILGPYIETFDRYAGQALYDLAIAVSPTSAEEVHIGGINCWKSIDGGTTWNYTSYWNQTSPAIEGGKFTHGDIHSLIFNGNILYCGSDGGVYYSDNNALSWTDISFGLEITQYYNIGVPVDNVNVVYGGSQDIGLNKWTASKKTEMDNQIGGDMVDCVVDYLDAGTVYAIDNGGSYLYVTDNSQPEGWDRIKTNLVYGGWVVPLMMHPTDHTKLFAAYDAIYQITDLGKSFNKLSPRLGKSLDNAIVALGASATGPFYMYAAIESAEGIAGGIKQCTTIDSPEPVWDDITGTLPVDKASLTDLAVSVADGGKAWVSFSGYANGTKIYQTSNAGKTWINISGSLPNVPVNCIVYYNNGKDGLYIGSDIGVFYRDNSLSDWIPFRNGLPNVIVTDLKITNNRIRAATYGRGIWESDLYGSCIPDYTLSGDVTGYQFFEANDAITSTTNVKGGIGTSVKYKAFNKITLNTGFRVVPESGFVASIGYCTNMQTYQRKHLGVYEGVMKGVLGVASIADSTTLARDRLKVYPGSFPWQNMIEFYVAKQDEASITLLDASGKKVKKILFESPDQPAGNYQIRLGATGFKPGKYLIRLKTNDYRETETITVTK